VTELEKVIGKKLKMEVATDVELEITVENEQSIVYQFVGADEKGNRSEDAAVRTKLEIAHDDIDGVDDYSFKDKLGGQFFLFQFDKCE